MRITKTACTVYALLVSCLLAGCASSSAGRAPSYRAHADHSLGSGRFVSSLIVEPDQGVRPLVREIDRAQHTVFVESYILTEKHIVRALERAAAQGVDVRVLMEHHPYGLSINPGRQVDLLRAAGVQVRWGNPLFTYTHAKYMVLDDRKAVVGTGNLSRSAFARNREFFVFDDHRQDVVELSNVFRADWDRLSPVLNDANVAVSPENSRTKLLQLIALAVHSIRMYGEEIADPRLEAVLQRLHARGIQVRMLLPWRASVLDVALLVRRGVQVRELRTPYIHAKYVGVDDRIAWLGSENFSTTSLDRNREVALLLAGRVIQSIKTKFDQDWRNAAAANWRTGLPQAP